MEGDSKQKPDPAERSASALLVWGVIGAMALVMVAILSLQLGTGRLPAAANENDTPSPEVDATPREPPALKPGLDEKMTAALQAFNQDFKPRIARDYSPTIQAAAAGQQRQPFMLQLDVNRDGAPDVILDGHDDRRNVLLCLLSGSDGYEVVVIRESSLVVPGDVKSWNDGVRETGLNYYLWPHGTGTGFTLAFPQQSDPAGALLNDGAIIDYAFSAGAFIESFQIP